MLYQQLQRSQDAAEAFSVVVNVEFRDNFNVSHYKTEIEAYFREHRGYYGMDHMMYLKHQYSLTKTLFPRDKATEKEKTNVIKLLQDHSWQKKKGEFKAFVEEIESMVRIFVINEAINDNIGIDLTLSPHCSFSEI